MIEKLKFVAFWLRYQLHCATLQFKTKTDNRYMLVFTGRYPSQLDIALRDIISPTADLRYSISANCVFITFYSPLKFRQVEKHLLRFVQGQVENLLVLTMSDFASKLYSVNMTNRGFFNLFGTPPLGVPESPYERLSQMQMIINTVVKTRQQLNHLMQEMTSEQENSNISEQNNDDFIRENDGQNQAYEEDLEASINKILAQIQEFGYESLSQEQKIILQNYGK